MPIQIKAAILRQIGFPLSVEDIEFGSLAHGQVLVKMSFSGICRSQLMECEGKRGEDRWLPHLLGHEGYGVVEAIGDGVTKCKPGDRVVLSWVKGRGIDAENAVFVDSNNKKVNSGKVATFSNFSIASENCVYLAPVGFDEKFLALFGCALLTGGGMAIRYGNAVEVRKICVIGFGGIGSAAALVLKGMGKSEVEIIEKSPYKRELAVSLGFKKVYSNVSQGLTDYDLVIEASGSVDSIESGFSRLSKSGTLVFASHPETGSKISLDPHDLIKGKKIFGTWGGDVNPDTEMEIIGKFLVDSGVKLNLLLGDIFTIDEVNQGMAYLKSGKVGRPLLKFREV